MLAVDNLHVVLSVVCELPSTAHQDVTLISGLSSTILADADDGVPDDAEDVTPVLLLAGRSHAQSIEAHITPSVCRGSMVAVHRLTS